MTPQAMTEYRIVFDAQDEVWVCAVFKNAQIFGSVSTYATYEQVFAWLRLVMGAYPGTFVEFKEAENG